MIQMVNKPPDDKMGMWVGVCIAVISMVGAVAVSYSSIMYADAKEGTEQLASVVAQQVERLYERDDTIYANLDAEVVEIRSDFNASNSKQWDILNRLREDVSRLDERSKGGSVQAQRVMDLNSRLRQVEEGK